jgi:hypothetical protein
MHRFFVLNREMKIELPCDHGNEVIPILYMVVSTLLYYSLSDFCNGRYLWFSPGTLVPSIDKNDHHDITEILLKVALNNNTQTQTLKWPE